MSNPHDYGRRAWAPPGPTFNPMARGKRFPKDGRMPGASINSPPMLAPDCPITERDAALAALDKMHRERPLRPPGR